MNLFLNQIVAEGGSDIIIDTTPVEDKILDEEIEEELDELEEKIESQTEMYNQVAILQAIGETLSTANESDTSLLNFVREDLAAIDLHPASNMEAVEMIQKIIANFEASEDADEDAGEDIDEGGDIVVDDTDADIVTDTTPDDDIDEDGLDVGTELLEIFVGTVLVVMALRWLVRFELLKEYVVKIAKKLDKNVARGIRQTPKQELFGLLERSVRTVQFDRFQKYMISVSKVCKMAESNIENMTPKVITSMIKELEQSGAKFDGIRLVSVFELKGASMSAKEGNWTPENTAKGIELYNQFAMSVVSLVNAMGKAKKKLKTDKKAAKRSGDDKAVTEAKEAQVQVKAYGEYLVKSAVPMSKNLLRVVSLYKK